MKIRGSSSAYMGVTWTGTKWRAGIILEGTFLFISNFDDPREAALAHDQLALLHFGKEAMLNFPAEAKPASLEEVRRRARTLRKAGCTSKYRGVYWDTRGQLWSARLHIADRARQLGRFEREEDAARAYDYAAWRAHGTSAILNFTTPPTEPPAPLRRRRTPQPKISKYRGVARVKQGDSFTGQLIVDGKLHYLGNWPKERQAAIAYDRAVLHFGLDHALNLPATSRPLGPLSPRLLQNQARLTQRKQRGKMPYIGVRKMPDRRRWNATVVDPSGQIVHAGAFDEPELAAVAYDRVVLHLHGPAAIRNFPERSLKLATPEAMRELAHRLFKERTSSQYRGVRLSKDGRWTARIGVDYASHHLGTFEVEEEAAEAYDNAAKRLHRERAKVNFED
jgi:hypothetical protein